MSLDRRAELDTSNQWPQLDQQGGQQAVRKEQLVGILGRQVEPNLNGRDLSWIKLELRQGPDRVDGDTASLPVEGGCLCGGGVYCCKHFAVGKDGSGCSIHEESSGSESVVVGVFVLSGNVVVEICALEVVPTNVFKSGPMLVVL